ncbi:glycoside hydrolase family 71/99-like protein [Kutzneria sp. 744]|uniref:glycoside hydrolase family 71/99-like protein n=1 Tax=Kutzneria sp. (strain 744) TaxID=345341 RepID=UPI0003EEC10E|nr:glycoside hydrolase family 71/99-like protein [Kutzneria sp. 744]EWM18549.1 xylosidase/arabinosidase [Kutzneria sp. 744]
MLRKTLVVATAFLVTAALALPATAAVTHPSVKGKVYAGYQGWFDAPGSGSPINNWVHWSGGTAPSPGHQTFEIYPDMRPYPANDQFRTGYANLGNGQPSTLFSSYVTQTVDLQFSWMQKFGIDGAALQRFTSDLVQPGSARYNQRNAVTAKARDAAQKYGRAFYIEYDLSGMTDDREQAVKNDWTNVVKNSLHLTDSSSYAYQDGKPVVELWGMGVVGSAANINPSLDLVNWFKAQGLYVIGGVPRGWRTDTNSKPGYAPVYQALNMVSPWNVGSQSVDGSLFAADLKALSARGQDYQPVIYPGFAWSNWNGGARNMIPRKAGSFLWQQAAALRQNGVGQAFIAMFDEYDEGTAIAPLAEDSSMIPTNQYFLTASADGTFLSSDFYLRLSGAATKMINGSAPLTPNVPIPPTDGPVAFRTGFERGLDAMPSTGSGVAVANHVLRAQGSSASRQQVFTVHIPVQVSTKLSYDLLSGGGVTVDLLYTDGTSTAGPDAVSATWTHVSRDLGAAAGKTISGIVVNTSGAHDASLDNLQIAS